MKLLLSFIALLLSAGAMAQSKTEKEITAQSKKRIQWLLEGKTDSLATMYDANSITIHGNGMIKSKDEHLLDVRQGRPVYKSIDVSSETVKDFGNTAILVGKGVFTINMGGEDMRYEMAYTEVYQKKGEKWLLISRHAANVR